LTEVNIVPARVEPASSSRVAAIILAPLVAGLATPGCSDRGPPVDRTRDVIYGRKHGMALTMDVFRPRARPNGRGIVYVVSVAWNSTPEGILTELVRPLTERGFTVFAVVHGSQPKFAIPEMIADLNRAVRFIRHHAREYEIDPDRIGAMGGSAGGHLALMLGLAGGTGDPGARDPVDRESSRVQAVACFYPPTDFLNFGTPGENALGRGATANLRGPFDFQVLDEDRNVYSPVTDEGQVAAIGRRISPVTHVSVDGAPTLIVHGDADRIVPIQQSEMLMARLAEQGVEAKLVVRAGAGHGWPGMDKDVGLFADWFAAHLSGRGDRLASRRDTRDGRIR
jgi:acetyl esterase/lipase